MQLADIREAIQSYAESFDASALSGTEALRGMRSAAAIKNIAATIEARCGARAADTKVHCQTGDRSPAQLMARETGSTVGQAQDALDTAARLADQSELNDATRRGEVSPQQASAVSDAARSDPTAERRLLDGIRNGASLAETRDEAARIKAAARTDPEALRKRIHAERFLRTFTDGEGAGNLRMRDNPEVIAQVMARVDAIADDIFHEHRRSAQLEKREAYAADALVRLATTDNGGTAAPARPKIIFRVDWAAWLRGWPQGDEVVELVGYGPVAPSAVDEAIAAGGFIAAVMNKSEQLTGVAHLGRTPTAKQQTALEWLYPTCAALSCFQTARLQRDHRVNWADTKITMLDWLDLLCSHHHGLKTQKNWALVEGRGKRPFVPPDDARHPSNANAPPVTATRRPLRVTNTGSPDRRARSITGGLPRLC